jgi:anthranilate synthase component 2
MKVLLIDNYDSFVYNLVHLFGAIKGVELVIKRNDDASFLPEIAAGVYDAVIIGPGPGSPEDAHYFGNCREVILEYGTEGLPILGVCLGFQGIAHCFGASLKRANTPVHGKLSEIEIIEHGDVFEDVPNHVEVMRYHSLMVDPSKAIPSDILVTAEVVSNALSTSQNGREIMAVRHKNLPIFGVQFHPESFATEAGDIVARNFISIAQKHKFNY